MRACDKKNNLCETFLMKIKLDEQYSI